MNLIWCALAAIARKVYLETGLGVGTLTKYHGGAKRRGALPSKHCAGSGSVIRKALQSLEKMKVVEKDQNGYVLVGATSIAVFFNSHNPSTSGRRLTQIGRQELDRIAQQIGAQ